jgi:TIR domain
MADVFISYSKAYRKLTASLASDLERAGYSVWWDTSLIPGDDFAEIILKQLDEAKAAIVLWTPASVKSRWVRSEARRADAARKLVPLRSVDITEGDIPPPYDILHTVSVEDRTAIIAALERLGVTPNRSNEGPDRSFKPENLSPEQIAEAKELAHWELIKASVDPKDFLAFLERFPNGTVWELASRRLEQLEEMAWRRAVGSNQRTSIRRFLEQYPGSRFQRDAEARLETLEQLPPSNAGALARNYKPQKEFHLPQVDFFPTIILLTFQLAVAWFCAPYILRYIPGLGQLQLFVYAAVFAVLVWVAGLVLSQVLRGMGQPRAQRWSSRSWWR